ncbi:high affinity copper uptake protein 1-like isoform X2 [Glandiceps talaboti]
MYFHFNADVTILFSRWHVTNASQLALSCFMVFFMAFFYEGLKVLRHWLLLKYIQSPKKKSEAEVIPSENQAILKKGDKPDKHITMCSGFHLIQTALHLLQMALAYSLMLIFMTYNAWLALAVLIGLVFGHFLFAWRNYTMLANVE